MYDKRRRGSVRQRNTLNSIAKFVCVCVHVCVMSGIENGLYVCFFFLFVSLTLFAVCVCFPIVYETYADVFFRSVSRKESKKGKKLIKN